MGAPGRVGRRLAGPMAGCKFAALGASRGMPGAAFIAILGSMEQADSPIDADAAWAAVLRRDRGADGRFVTGVLSTGIYCRPSCAARHPQRGNVRFFADGAAASSISDGIASDASMRRRAAAMPAASRATSSGRQRRHGRRPAPRAAAPSAKKRTLPRCGWRAAQDGRQ